MSTTIKQEHRGEVFTVPGRFHNVIAWPNDPKLPERCRGRIANQQWTSDRRPHGKHGEMMRVSLCFDDECKNGHESFGITADIFSAGGRYVAGGCLHDEIAKTFPELRPLIKWHLCSTDGPMHYVANTIYLAGDRDHNGLRKGEKQQIKNGRTGEPCWELVAVIDGEERPIRELKNHIESEATPEAPPVKYAPWCRIGEGKERQLDAARSVAIWPEATDEQLTAEPEELRRALEGRLPELLERFEETMRSCGFVWPEKEAS